MILLVNLARLFRSEILKLENLKSFTGPGFCVSIDKQS